MKEILIVEDDIALGMGLCRALASVDIHPVSCDTLQKAQQLLTSQPWNLIILDVNLPDGNGFDFLVSLRQHIQTPVILLTV